MTDVTPTDTLRVKKVGITLLNGTLIVLGLCVCTILYGTLSLGEDYEGINIVLFLGIVAVMALMRFLCSRNWVTTASIGFVGTFAFGCTYGAFMWGASMPLTLLGFGLTIVFATSLLGNKGGIVTLIYTATILVVAGLFEMQNEIPKWKSEHIIIADLIIYSVMLALTTLVGWLSHKQIMLALAQAHSAEKVLENERLIMGNIIDQRTKEIEQTHNHRLAHIQQNAEFGKVAQGLFHDMIGPVNTLTLTISALHAGRMSIADAYLHSESVYKVIQRSQNYIQTIRRNLGKKNHIIEFDIKEEISSAILLHQYRARRECIDIAVHGDACNIYGDAIQFNQAISIFISNSIDAFESVDRATKRILIHWKIRPDHITLTVKDSAKGMSTDTLTKILTPFFTTKTDGNGFGLSAAHNTIHNLFKGTLHIESELDKGTSIICRIPRTSKPTHDTTPDSQSSETSEVRPEPST